MESSDCKINVYVHSKFWNPDESVSNFNVKIPDGLLKVQADEFFSLDVNCFHVYNTFYQCNVNSNHFQLIIRTPAGLIYNSTDMYLNNGSPNVYDVLANLQTLLSAYVTITYNRITNRFTYTALTINSFTTYIKPLGAYSFLGFKNNVETLISTSGTICTNAINVVSIHTLNIVIDGDISFANNNLDNVFGFYQNTDIILQKAVDVPKNGLIQYENIDGGDSFHFLLCNIDRIKYFSLSVFDQDMNVIADLPDYNIHLQFIIHKKDQSKKLLRSINENTNNSYLILGYIMEMITNFIKLFSKS